MAECSFYQNEHKLSDIEKILTCLSQPQDKVERALEELCCILTNCASSDSDDDIRHLCFSKNIVKALLGILRSSSQVSMLVLACRCISSLIHGNDDGRIRLGELGVIPVLISLLHFHLEQRKKSRAKSDGRTHDRVDSLWLKDWVPVYEQVLICLRKLTFYNMTNQQEMARIGGIKIVVALATDQGLTSNFGEFSPEAKQCMESVSLQKKFISRVSPVPDDEKCDVLRAFPALCTDIGPAIYYPAFYVDLITRDGIMVTQSLLDKGVVWPALDDTTESFQWTCLMVGAVEDGNSLWCQFCLKNPSRAILDMTAALNSLEAPDIDEETGQATDIKMAHVSAPIVGESYVTYLTAPLSSVPDPATTNQVPCAQWFRVRVLRMVSRDLSLVLAIDFGFTVTLDSTMLYPLPDQCRGIPPQAVPCRLRGIAPVPSSVAILENSAAVIRNMSFEKLAFCKEIQNFKGIEAMIKLAQCPEKEVLLQALGALVNLILAKSLKEDIGRKGAIKVALDLVRHCSDGDVLQWAIGVLLNGVTDCKANIALFRELKGEAVLREVKLDNIPNTQHGNLQHWIEDILSILSSSPSKSVVEQVPKRSPPTQRYLSLYQARRRANGERSHSYPIVHHCDSDDQSHELDVDHAHPAISCSPSPSRQLTSTPIPSTLPTLLSGKESCVLTVGADIDSHISMDNRSYVAYFKRDDLCNGVDVLMSSAFKPPIQSDQYRIIFHSIALPATATSGRSGIIPDWCVVEVRMNVPTYHQVYTIQEKCPQGFSYERSAQGMDEELSFQELRDLVASKEADNYQEVVRHMARNI